MSSRQQLLYIMQMSQQGTEWNNNNANGKPQKHQQTPEEKTKSYNQLFEERRKNMKSKDLQEHPERWRMLAHSLTQFIPIKKNRFLERNRSVLHPNDYITFQCQCQPISHSFGRSKLHDTQSYDCGEQCLNRSVNQDCLPQICPVGDGCKNRRFQQNQNSYVYPVKTCNKGWGLAAGEFIAKGKFVMQYVGDVFYVDSDIGKKRIELYKNSTCTYMMRTENGEVIDPTTHGNIARFINHSCDPNCVTRKWTVLGETSVGIFALRDIEEDEELSFDYQFDTFKTPFTRCYCGTSKCKGYLGLGVFEDDGINQNAPICQHCQKIVAESSQLLVCGGPCRNVFHIQCAAQIDKRLKTQQSGTKRQKYFCKDCYYVTQGKKKPGRKSQKDLDELDPQEMISDPNEDAHSIEVKTQAKEVEKLILTDSQARKFCEDNAENRLLDKVIKREIYWIDKLKQEPELETKTIKSKKDKKRKNLYSEFYNFYFELCVRLKKRMKENKTNFKFRKNIIFDDSQMHVQVEKAAKPARGRSQKVLKAKKQRSFSSSLSASVHSSPKVQKRRLVKTQKAPRVIKQRVQDRPLSGKQSSNVGSDESMINQSNSDLIEQSQQNLDRSKPLSSLSRSLQSRNSEDLVDSGDSDLQKDLSLQTSSRQNNFQSLLQSQESEESEQSEEEQIQIDDEEDGSEEAEEEQEESIEDVPFSEDEESEEEILDSSIDSSSSEEVQSQSSSRSLMSESEADQIVQPIKKRGRKAKIPPKKLALRVPRKKPDLSQLKNTLSVQYLEKVKAVRKTSQVEKDLQKEAKNKVVKQIRDLVNNFLEDELELSNIGETKTFKVNLYEQVFKYVIDFNTDLFECIPGLQFTWNQPWGNLVTLKVTTYARQQKRLLDIAYKAGNLLQQNNFLSEVVGFSFQEDRNVEKQTSLPFLIMKILVGKNLIKKLIGYQERTLQHLRKKYSVGFDFDETLVNDVVYQLSETSPLYVFGRGRDVVRVCQLLQEELDKLQVRTFYITKEESNFILVNIKEVKSFIDPCEIRVRRTIKEKAEINHPFYQVPNLSREVCLIGTEQELNRAELRLYEFYSMRLDAPDLTRTSICFLLPSMLQGEKRAIKTELFKDHPDIQFLAIEPIFPRKHLTIFLQGPWKGLMAAKESLIKIVNPSFNRIWQPSYKTFDEFQQFVLTQALRFCFKQLKRSQLEKTCKFQTHWDICSIEIESANLYQQLRISEEQEEFNLVSRLLGKEYLARMRMILSKEVHTDPCSIFQHPDMKEKFLSLRPEQQQQIISIRQRRKFLKHQRVEQYKNILRYLKVHDMETCLNALFVLAGSHTTLGELIEKLALTKDQVIMFADNLVKDLLKQYSFPSLNSYLKHRQNKEMRQVAEQNAYVRHKQKIREFQLYLEDERREEMLLEKRRSRSRDREERDRNSLHSQEPAFFQQEEIQRQQAYEVINPTLEKDKQTQYQYEQRFFTKSNSRNDFIDQKRYSSVDQEISLKKQQSVPLTIQMHRSSSNLLDQSNSYPPQKYQPKPLMIKYQHESQRHSPTSKYLQRSMYPYPPQLDQQNSSYSSEQKFYFDLYHPKDYPKRYDYPKDFFKREECTKDYKKREDYPKDYPKREESPKDFNKREEYTKIEKYSKDFPRREDYPKDYPKPKEYFKDYPKPKEYFKDYPKSKEYFKDYSKRDDSSKEYRKHDEYPKELVKRDDYVKRDQRDDYAKRIVKRSRSRSTEDYQYKRYVDERRRDAEYEQKQQYRILEHEKYLAKNSDRNVEKSLERPKFSDSIYMRYEDRPHADSMHQQRQYTSKEEIQLRPYTSKEQYSHSYFEKKRSERPSNFSDQPPQKYKRSPPKQTKHCQFNYK